METLEKKGKGSALLPFLLFIVIYLGAGLYFQAQGVEMAFYQFPSVTAMFIALLLAFCQGKGTIDQKFTVFAKGAANENVLTMLMIYILAGAFSTVASAMGGVDAIVFTGGIGEHDEIARAKVCHHMDWLGIRIDTEKNEHPVGDVCDITAWGAKVRTLVIATDEELMIARDTKEVLEK